MSLETCGFTLPPAETILGQIIYFRISYTGLWEIRSCH